MAEADDHPKRPPYVPPGFHLLVDDVAAEGAEVVRDRLARGDEIAYVPNHRTGLPDDAIPRQEWWSAVDTPDMLARGIWLRWVPNYGYGEPRKSLVGHHILVRDRPTPLPPAPDAPSTSEPEPLGAEPVPRRRKGGGRKPEFDWDVIRAYCDLRFNDDGVPASVSKFCEEKLIPWCQRRYKEDEIPELETLRKAVARWKAAWLEVVLPE